MGRYCIRMSGGTDSTTSGTMAKTGRLPWHLHPAPTEERLSACARLLARPG